MAGIPDIKRVARQFGDWSALGVGGTPTTQAIQNRVRNRALGWSAGRAYGLAKSHFGIFGLFAFAQFMGYLNDLLKAAHSSEYWVGNMTRYAGWVDRGFVHNWNGLPYPPTYFYRDALVQAVNEHFRSNAFSGYGPGTWSGRALKPAKSLKEGIWRGRTGLYEGQRFLGDMYGVLRGDAVGRVARREAGRATAGFIWGTLLNPTNQFEKLAKKVVANARRNIKNYPSTSKKTWGLSQAAQNDPVAQEILSRLPKRDRVIYDTGFLWATMAVGATEFEMINASVEQGRAYAGKIGEGSDFVDRRMSWSKSSGGGGRTFELHGDMMGGE